MTAIWSVLLLITLFSIWAIQNQDNLHNNNWSSISSIPESATITGINPPISGTWIISIDTIVDGENLQLNGSIQISSGVTLQIMNSKINFKDDANTYDISGVNCQLIIGNSEISNFEKISTDELSNVTVFNSNFSEFLIGFSLFSSNFSLYDSNLMGGDHCLWLNNVNDSKIVGNEFSSLNETFFVQFCNNTHIENNTLTGSSIRWTCNGISCEESSYFTIINNTFYDYQKCIEFNTATDSYFAFNNFLLHPNSPPEAQGEIQFMVNCNRILFENNTIKTEGDGVEIYESSNIEVRNNHIEYCPGAIYCEFLPMQNISIHHNTLINSSMTFCNVTNINVTFNTIENGSISVRACYDGIISNNTICGYTIKVNWGNNIVVENNTYTCSMYQDEEAANEEGNKPNDHPGDEDEEDGGDVPWFKNPMNILPFIMVGIIIAVVVFIRKKRIGNTKNERGDNKNSFQKTED